MRLWQLFSFEPKQSNAQHKELIRESNTKWKMATGEKWQTSVEVTREPKTRIGARETGQQASEKKAEERTYKLVKKRAVDAEEDRCGTRVRRWTRRKPRKHRSTEQPAHD